WPRRLPHGVRRRRRATARGRALEARPAGPATPGPRSRLRGSAALDPGAASGPREDDDTVRYEEPAPIDRDTAVAMLDSGDVEQASRALVGLAFHDPDWRWVQDRCLELLGSADVDAELHGLAATCL